MISNKVHEAINAQINKELYSAYLYLALAAKAIDMKYTGTGHWMKKQAKEELEHADKFFNYLTKVNKEVKLETLRKPEFQVNSLVEVFENSLKHEQFITKSIHDLYTLAQAENDTATQVLLHWFIDEQVEEEANAQEVLDQLALISGDKGAVYQLDQKLGSR